MKDKPVFYLYIQKKLMECCKNPNKALDFNEVNFRLGNMRIPKILNPAIIKEMEKLELVERVNRYTLKIINCNEGNQLNKINQVYHGVGLW